jgi:hypothetical protein
LEGEKNDMTEQPRYESEKQEKGEEKEQEKQQEKESEKRWDEKWRRDPLGSIVWASILIWAGLVFLADNLNMLNQFGILGIFEAWSLAFAGAGVILIVEAFLRILIPAYRRPVVGTIIVAFVFLGIAFGDTIGWGLIWPFILIGIGLAFLLTGLTRRR